jgi:hypothetical protein
MWNPEGSDIKVEGNHWRNLRKSMGGVGGIKEGNGE